MRFPDFNWATYDMEFHQQAAATVITASSHNAPTPAQPSRTHPFEQNLMAPSTRSPSWKAPVYMD